MNQTRITLADGHVIPQLGYGVWRIADEIASQCVRNALDAGYRHIDTAKIYENERGVGEGLRSSNIPRSELFITTKLWNDAHGDLGAVRKALEDSLIRLDLDYVDLYLMHWPCPARDEFDRTWKALVQLGCEKLTRSVGVSNFNADHLERAIEFAGQVPVINQVELHPYMQQRELRKLHESYGIVTEAWSPLGRGGELLQDPVICAIAAELGVGHISPAQVVLRWHLQHGIVVIPKSQTPARIIENFSLDDFELSEGQMTAIDALDRGSNGRIGPDPAVANF